MCAVAISLLRNERSVWFLDVRNKMYSMNAVPNGSAFFFE
ncbi:hypothetical protein BH10BAC6_BH10BAC6_16140 [soil metagenome]